ncbi:MAG: division/cell wall cluster transcriptional repressor MraZ [Treponema sp.]|jgi:MraZ protein|nr:division/cell wall cluster transcriptional repressor MraZ [Treponema sp.]
MELRTGTFEGTLDEKGRVGVPVRLRERYSGELVITQGMQSISAWIMTPQVWEQAKERLEASADTLTWEEYQDIRFQFVLPAQVVEFDKSGRIAVPAAIRTYAGLTRDCLVLSDEDHLEIWDAKSYYDYLRERRPVIQETMKKMGSLRLFGSK